MQALYLAPWAWVTEGAQSFWQMPRADIGLGSLDLRSLPQCGDPGTQFSMRGWFSLMQQDDLVGLKLGDLGALVGAPMKAALASRLNLDLGESIVASDNIGILVELLNHHADPTGQARWKPLRGSLRNGMRLYFANQLVWQDRFDADPIYPANTKAVFQVDYRRNRTLPDSLSGLEREVWTQGFRTKEERAGDTRITEAEARKRWLTALRKWTGSTMLKLWGQMSDELAAQLLPSEYVGDGWDKPTTVFTDNFDRADSTNLGADWDEYDSGLAIQTNRLGRDTSNDLVAARWTSNLATDDHYTQAILRATGAGSEKSLTVTTRMAATGTTPDYYEWMLDYAPYNANGVYKSVAGVRTQVASAAFTPSLDTDYLFRLESSDSTHTAKRDGVTILTPVDTSVTGNLRPGLRGWLASASDNEFWDNFEAGDLAAAALNLERIERHYPRGVARGVLRGVA